jgi:hypothetical protein
MLYVLSSLRLSMITSEKEDKELILAPPHLTFEEIASLPAARDSYECSGIRPLNSEGRHDGLDAGYGRSELFCNPGKNSNNFEIPRLFRR